MGWFVLACLIGFALFWFCYEHRGFLGLLARYSWIPLIVLIVVAIIGGIFGIGTAWAGHAIERMGSGDVARILLGLALGFGLGFALMRHVDAAAQRAAAPVVVAGGAPPAPPPEGGIGAFLSVVIVIVLLALVAPHVDRWLSHLTALKTSVIEIQLANIATGTKAVKPDSRAHFVDVEALGNMAAFADELDDQIEFIELFELPDVAYRLTRTPGDVDLAGRQARLIRQKQQLTELRHVFRDVVSPLSQCLDAAIDAGYGMASARVTLRPLAEQLIELSILQGQAGAGSSTAAQTPDVTDRVTKLTERAWTLLRETRQNFDLYLTDDAKKKCPPDKLPSANDKLPRLADYSKLPHLYLAMSYLFLVVNDDALALRTLEHAQKNWEFADVRSNYMEAMLRFYRGDSVVRYIDEFDGMRREALRQLAVIDDVIARCGRTCDAKLKEAEKKFASAARSANLYAMNDIAYGIAEDLAEGRESADGIEPIAIAYAKKLREAADDPKNGDSYLDTADFVTIVVEARKSTDRDLKKIELAVDDFRAIIARQEHKVASLASPGPEDYLAMKEVRAHLAGARGLLE